MENGQMPPVQPIVSQPTTSIPPAVEAQPTPVNGGAPMGMPGQPVMIQQVAAPVPEKKFDVVSLVKTIAIVTLSLVSVTFIGLFIWMNGQYSEAREDVDGQIAAAVSEAVDENSMKLEVEFAEREKYPYQTFAGPVDYGELSFEYPKTWSVYIGADAVTGGDFQAYLNPIEVNPVGENTINALRVSILDKSFDTVAAEYQREMERQEIDLSLESVMIGDGTITANRYTGTIPNSELSGFIVIFKIRDKTAILQTDSVLFESDYNTLLKTVRFNA